MTGNNLKITIKKMGLTQAEAADKLGITRATLNNWCKLAELPPASVASVRTLLGIGDDEPVIKDPLMETIRSQQKTIEELTYIIKNLTSKNG